MVELLVEPPWAEQFAAAASSLVLEVVGDEKLAADVV